MGGLCCHTCPRAVAGVTERMLLVSPASSSGTNVAFFFFFTMVKEKLP